MLIPRNYAFALEQMGFGDGVMNGYILIIEAQL